MGNRKIILSVHMITYNHENYIGDAIKGVLNQKTNFPIELIISDDYSTDNTRLIIEQYVAQNSNLIKPLYRQKNLGSMANYIDTFSHCSGKYIAICEGDDFWTDPDKLQKQVDFLEANEEYGLVYTNYRIRTEHSHYPDTLPCITCHSGSVIDMLIRCNFIASLTVCFRSSLLRAVDFGEMSRSNFLLGDYPIWLQLANISKIHYINEVTAIYRVLSESASHTSSFEKRERFLLSVLKLQMHYMNKFGIIHIPERELLISQYFYIMDAAFAVGDFLKAKEYAGQLPLNSFNMASKYLVTRNVFLFRLYNGIIKVKHNAKINL